MPLIPVRLSYAAAPLAALLLAGCGDEPGEPKTADEVIEASRELTKPRPGQYVSSTEVIDFSVPGLPPEQAEQMKAMMGGMAAEETSYCLTPAEAEKGFEDAVRKMGEGGTDGMNCEFNRFDVSGDGLDAELACTGPQGMNATMKMDGTMAAESSTMHMEMTQKAAQIPGGEMSIEMRMKSRRVGECT